MRLEIHTSADDLRAHGPLLASLGATVAEGKKEWLDYFRVLCSADALLLPISFSSGARTFMRYSIPGKLAEYCATGLPILSYAPPDVAQSSEARRFGYAEVVDSQDPDAIRRGIRIVMFDAERRQALRTKSAEHLRARYSPMLMRERLRHSLATAAYGRDGTA